MDDAPAFYALEGGGWRAWWTLLHPPYTIWHLSYVVLGVCAAPIPDAKALGYSLAAFFLAVGIGAHALDERNGHPLRTGIAGSTLLTVAAVAVAGAVGIGVYGITETGLSLLPFMVFGAFIVAAYNLEWFGGRFHTDLWFAAAWGAFPAMTAFWASGGRAELPGPLVALACFAVSAAQRTLSTPVRALRRRTTRVEGTIERTDGTIESITKTSIGAPAEHALRALSLAMPLLAGAVAAARF